MAALLGLLGTFAAIVVHPSHASASVGTFPWPGTPLPYANIFTHGNNSLTVVNADCGNYYNWSASSLAFTTLASSGTTLQTSVRSAGGWTTTTCGRSSQEVGVDNTTYFIQNQTTSPYASRLTAMRDGTVLWTQTKNINCGTSSRQAIFQLPTLGYDGNIYLIAQPTNCSLAGYTYLVKVNSVTGHVAFWSRLPGDPSVIYGSIMPYDGGIAVLNNGLHVYYYDYSGALDNSKTFSPSGTSFQAVSTNANGRTFIQIFAGNTPHVYYKDLASTTVSELTLPAGVTWATEAYAAPSNGAIVLFSRPAGKYFGYYDASGTLAYEKPIATDGTQHDGLKLSATVDSLGNFVLVRQMTASSQNDQNLYVDSFDPSGNETHLFDSGAEFGTAQRDLFSKPGDSNGQPLQIGSGVMYLPFCHATVPVGQGGSVTCTASNTQIAVIPVSSQFDYPRSAVFAKIKGRVQYAALGDSYSSGEGNPAFISPTDNNGGDGCDRSESQAYPELLATDLDFNLQAFVACSGATSSEIYTGKNGEPGQLDSLGVGTDIITVTAGGNDVGFSDFAAECVVGTCDSASSQYQYTTDEIDNYLQDNLELLFSRIRAAAPNAAIKVIGYPQVVASGGSCPIYLSSGEQIAIDTVITGLNAKLYAAVQNAGTGFQFIDPTMSGSPFEGHDLCSADPYFFGLNIAEHRFSFHPNAAGQAAYEELIANLI